LGSCFELVYLFFLFAQVFDPTLDDFHEKLQRSLDEKIQDKNEDVDFGKIEGKPPPGADNGNADDIEEKSKDIFLPRDHHDLLRHPTDAHAKKGDDEKEEEEDNHVDNVKLKKTEERNHNPKNERVSGNIKQPKSIPRKKTKRCLGL